MRVEHIGDATLYLGDCLEILPTLGKVDAVVTDPPYGVGLGEVVNGQALAKGQLSYTKFSDTPEYIDTVVVPAVRLSLGLSSRGMLTPGNRNAWKYPAPSDVGVWYNPAGSGRGRWGYILAHLILYYGKDPRAGKSATASSAWNLQDDVGEIKNKLHPCPKPESFTRWMVNKASIDSETILDPFMGSGTTGVACANLGRKFLGIEIEPKYFDIACKRIETAYLQPRLFEDERPKYKQENLID